MAYNQDIPQSTDRIKDSQPELLANFQAIKTLIEVNHVTFDDPSGDQGKHKFIWFPRQSVDPSTPANNMTLFNKFDTVSGASQLHLVKGLAGSAYPITSSGGPSGFRQAGWSYLPSGKIIKWAAGTTVGTSVVVNANTLPVGGPTLTAVQTVWITGNQNATFWLSAISGVTFTVNSSAANAIFSYVLIGSN